MYRKMGIIFLLLSLFVVQCKESDSTELKNWVNNQKELIETIATYPNFSRLLNEKLKSAKEIATEADKSFTDSLKSEKIKQANLQVKDLLNDFKTIRVKTESIEKAMKELENTALDPKFQKEKSTTIATARAKLNTLKSKLVSASAETESEGRRATAEAISALDEIQKNLDRALEETKKEIKP